ncbi:MAG: fibronectin type III domain-containing protein [Clostridia bacterium]|nr:fibronectin type III domain-containing protein [Clostridia bacterium]
MKKKLLTLTFTLVLLIGLVTAMGMNASAAGVPTALNRSPVVYTADNLWNYVAQSYDGDVIVLGQDITYDDKNDSEPYVLPFGSQSDMVLDLNGHTLDITTRADALIELDYGATRLHIINSKPETPAKIIMRTKRGDASIVDLSNKNCSLFVYDGVELAMGEKGDQAEAYRQTHVIKATAFSDIALYGATVTNNIANGNGIKLTSTTSVAFDSSTVTLHGGAVINAETSCIYLSDSYDYPTFKIGSAHLNCNEEYYEAIFNYIPASSATAQVKALTFGDILFSSKYAAYNATAGGRLDNNGISNSQKLIDFKTECDITFKLPGVLTECYHASTKSLLNSFCGHYTVCSDCYHLMEIEEHTSVAATVNCTSDGYTGGYNCACGYKTIKPATAYGHKYTEYAKKAATCTEYGYKNTMYKCESCATYFDSNKNEISFKVFSQNRIDPLGHDLYTIKAKEPTCTESGTTSDYQKCTRCASIFTMGGTPLGGAKWAAIYRTALGHDMVKVAAKKATTTADGNIEYYDCSRCDHISSDAEGKIAIETAKVTKIKSVTLSKTEYTYNGKEQKPSVTVKDSAGKTLKNGTDYKVTYESGRKNPGKYSVRVDFMGKYSGTTRVYYTIAPKVTSKVTIAQSTKAIKLTWEKVTGATGYRVYQYNTKTKKWDSIKTTTSTSYKVEKLKAGTIYKFRIKAYKKDDGTIWGKATETIETATKCTTPSITKLTTTKGKASFTWSNVSGESGFQVYYSTKKDSGYKKVKSYGANKLTGSKSKLKSGKKYYFKVRAYKKTASGTVYSSWSAVKSVKIK